MRGRNLVATVLAASLMMAGGAALAGDGDADAGKKVFKKCKACHTVEEGGKHKIGPNLYGVMGRESGMADGFKKYSKAMKEAAIVWTDETLGEYLADPKGYIPKNKMAFKGLKKEKDRVNVIAYIKQHGS